MILGLWAYAGALAWVSPTAQPTTILALYAANFVFHLLWSPLFFKLKRPDWAMAEMPLLWLSVLAMVIGLAPMSSLAALLLLPYLAWVAVAGWINLAVVRLNGPFGARAAAR